MVPWPAAGLDIADISLTLEALAHCCDTAAAHVGMSEISCYRRHLHLPVIQLLLVWACLRSANTDIKPLDPR